MLQIRHIFQEEIQQCSQLLFKENLLSGSYLYAPDPVMRNKFRGTAVQFTPQPASGMEENEWEDGQRVLFFYQK